MSRKALVIAVVVLSLAVVLTAAGIAVGLLSLRNASLAAAGAGPIEAASSAVPRVGEPFLDFSLQTPDHQTLQVSQFKGKPVILNFWATWCGPCSNEMPNIEKVYQQHRDDLTILAVNQGEKAEQVQGYSEIYHLHFPLLLDEHMQIGDRYRVQALPTTVFIDKTGFIREVHVGGPMSVDFIEGKIKTLFGE